MAAMVINMARKSKRKKQRGQEIRLSLRVLKCVKSLEVLSWKEGSVERSVWKSKKGTSSKVHSAAFSAASRYVTEVQSSPSQAITNTETFLVTSLETFFFLPYTQPSLCTITSSLQHLFPTYSSSQAPPMALNKLLSRTSLSLSTL